MSSSPFVLRKDAVFCFSLTRLQVRKNSCWFIALSWSPSIAINVSANNAQIGTTSRPSLVADARFSSIDHRPFNSDSTIVISVRIPRLPIYYIPVRRRPFTARNNRVHNNVTRKRIIVKLYCRLRKCGTRDIILFAFYNEIQYYAV